MTYPQSANPIVIERVEPEKNRVTAGPFEFGIIVADGEISDVFTEGYRTIPKGGMFGIGRRIDARAYIAYASPFELSFRLQDPNDRSAFGGVTLDAPVLTSDGQIVAASMILTLEAARDRIENLLQLLGQRRLITNFDIANRLKHEILGKVLALNLNYYTASQLRGNQNLLRQMDQDLRIQLDSTITGYGLRLTNFHMSWGLTVEESERIDERQHQINRRRIERDQEIRALQRQPLPSQPLVAPAPYAPAQPQRQTSQRTAVRREQPNRPPSSHQPSRSASTTQAYGVYTDLIFKYSTIHKTTCRFWKNRKLDLNQDENHWRGPYATIQQATTNPDTRGNVKRGGCCKP